MSITKSEWEQQYIDRMPDTQKGVFKRAYSGKSKKAAISAKCLDCTCFQRKEVELCEATTCPLYQYRPYKGQESQPSIVIIQQKKEQPKRAMSQAHKDRLAEYRKSKANKGD